MAKKRSLPARIAVSGLSLAAFCLNLSHLHFAQAQTTSWTAPSSGYVYDALTRSVRPVAGFLGSAVLGPAVLDQLDWVAIAPNGTSAIVQQSGSLLWIPDLAQPTREWTVAGVALVRQAFWAADSSRAVLLTEDAKLLWLTSFGSSAPSVQAEWPLRGLSPLASRGAVPRWSLLAADTAADRVLLVTSSVAGSRLWMASRTASPSALAFSGHPSAAAFAVKTATAFVADGEAHRIVRIRQLDGAPVPESVPVLEVYVDKPVGLALSADDTRLFIADRATTSIRIFDSSTGALTDELSADAKPIALAPFGPARFLLNSGGLASQPLLFLDTTPPAKVSFLPRGN